MSPRSAVPNNKVSLFRETTATVLKNPLAIILFIVLGLTQAIALTAVFLAHSEPLNSIIGPIIRRFWGERFLHYPDNFLLLPKLSTHAEMVVITFVGLLVTGVVIQLVASAKSPDHSRTVVGAAGVALKRYFGMLLVWFSIFLSLRYGARAAFDVLPQNVFVHYLGLLVLFLLAQALTSFLFISILLSGRKYWASLAEGAGLAVKNLHRLLPALLVPIAISVGLSFLKTMSPALSKSNPDMVLVILYCSIVVSIVVDLYITSATTILYLKVRSSK